MERNSLIGINLHGEAADMDDTEREATMKKWREEFHSVLDEYDLDPSCVYNANQTELKKSYAGVKQMKDKTQMTLMVCTAACSAKCPLAMHCGKVEKNHDVFHYHLMEFHQLLKQIKAMLGSPKGSHCGGLITYFGLGMWKGMVRCIVFYC